MSQYLGGDFGAKGSFASAKREKKLMLLKYKNVSLVEVNMRMKHNSNIGI